MSEMDIISEIAAERVASKSDEESAEIQEQVILNGEQYYCHVFLDKVLANDGEPIVAYGKLCHTFEEAREAMCEGVKKIFKEWKKKFLVVQKAKKKTGRPSEAVRLERRKARNETCLALLKEKWPKQYAQMLALGEALEKATCITCKRKLDWRFFISLHKKWSGGDADADLKAFMKHMKNGKCGPCGLAEKQSRNSVGTIEGMKKLLKEELYKFMKTFNFGLVEPVDPSVPLSSIQLDHVHAEGKDFKVSEISKWPTKNIDLVLEEFLKVVPTDSASHALKGIACGDEGKGRSRAAYDEALEPSRKAQRERNAGNKSKNRRLGLALRTANKEALVAMGLPKVLLAELNGKLMFGTFGSCAATGCKKKFVATPEEAAGSANKLHVKGCEGEHTTAMKDKLRAFSKLFGGTTKLSTTVKYLKEEIAKGMANVCHTCHSKKTDQHVNIYNGQRPRGNPEAIERYYKENPEHHPAAKRKLPAGKGKKRRRA